MRKLWLGGLVGAALSLITAGANASTATTSGLYNTGVDDSGNVLSDGSTDSHWLLTGSAGSTTYVLICCDTGSATGPGSHNWYTNWDQNGVRSPSAWIGTSTTNPPGAVPYTFTLTFNVSALGDITGAWYTDDKTAFYVNGTLFIPFGYDIYGPPSPFDIPSADLHLGSNTIALNMFSNDNHDDGVRVAFDSPTVSGTPLPGALPLLAGGLGVLGLLSRRRKQKTSSVIAA